MLISTKQNINLGDVPRGTIKEFEFDLTNNGLSPVSFTCSVSCGCTLPSFETMDMGQMTTQIVKCMFSTRDLTKGTFQKRINLNYFNSMKGIEDRYVITFTGTIV